MHNIKIIKSMCTSHAIPYLFFSKQIYTSQMDRLFALGYLTLCTCLACISGVFLVFTLNLLGHPSRSRSGKFICKSHHVKLHFWLALASPGKIFYLLGLSRARPVQGCLNPISILTQSSCVCADLSFPLS